MLPPVFRLRTKRGKLLLETSIRMASGERFAADAYSLLERELLMSYEGSEYEEIPPDERAVLDELAALIAGS